MNELTIQARLEIKRKLSYKGVKLETLCNPEELIELQNQRRERRERKHLQSNTNYRKDVTRHSQRVKKYQKSPRGKLTNRYRNAIRMAQEQGNIILAQALIEARQKFGQCFLVDVDLVKHSIGQINLSSLQIDAMQQEQLNRINQWQKECMDVRMRRKERVRLQAIKKRKKNKEFHPDKVKAYGRIASKRRRQTLNYRLRTTVVRRIKHGLFKQKLPPRKEQHTEEILGCSLSAFKQYIELRFRDGMTWDNHRVNYLPLKEEACKPMALTIGVLTVACPQSQGNRHNRSY